MKLMKKKYPAVLALIVSSLSVPAMAQADKSSEGLKKRPPGKSNSDHLSAQPLSASRRHHCYCRR